MDHTGWIWWVPRVGQALSPSLWGAYEQVVFATRAQVHTLTNILRCMRRLWYWRIVIARWLGHLIWGAWSTMVVKEDNQPIKKNSLPQCIARNVATLLGGAQSKGLHEQFFLRVFWYTNANECQTIVEAQYLRV